MIKRNQLPDICNNVESAINTLGCKGRIDSGTLSVDENELVLHYIPAPQIRFSTVQSACGKLGLQAVDNNGIIEIREGYMKTIITNAFSLNMLDRKRGQTKFVFTPISLREAVIIARRTNNLTVGIGHENTAAIVAELLNRKADTKAWQAIAKTRPNVSANDNQLLVAQYTGPRLQEGAKQLPEGAVIEFWHIVEEK